jgi:enoyl-CoA hydratase/carnithine racemase
VHRNGSAGDECLREEPSDPMSAFETILLDVDEAARVATVTLNRPDRLNSFDRTMCHEMADLWRTVKLDDRVNAVVLRAAGERAFSAGLDVKTPYEQPRVVWNHEDPGEFLSPKWQKMWKPVVCAVQGMCTAGAFYFVNESDVVICSSDATFFDSHVTGGLVSALEPIGLMRRVGLGETLRIALTGNDERVSAQTALRIGLVTEVVSADDLWSRAHEIAALIAAHPTTATQGTVKAIWESLDKPYRAALDQGLIYTRLGNAIGKSELNPDRRPPAPRIR